MWVCVYMKAHVLTRCSKQNQISSCNIPSKSSHMALTLCGGLIFPGACLCVMFAWPNDFSGLKFLIKRHDPFGVFNVLVSVTSVTYLQGEIDNQHTQAVRQLRSEFAGNLR